MDERKRLAERAAALDGEDALLRARAEREACRASLRHAIAVKLRESALIEPRLAQTLRETQTLGSCCYIVMDTALDTDSFAVFANRVDAHKLTVEHLEFVVSLASKEWAEWYGRMCNLESKGIKRSSECR